MNAGRTVQRVHFQSRIIRHYPWFTMACKFSCVLCDELCNLCRFLDGVACEIRCIFLDCRPAWEIAQRPILKCRPEDRPDFPDFVIVACGNNPCEGPFHLYPSQLIAGLGSSRFISDSR